MKPEWLKIKLPDNQNYQFVKDILLKNRVNTVCIEARCPNRIECWSKKSMTFMILGNICTRNCRFCAVKTGNPNGQVDESEPLRIAQIVSDLKLSHIVITSVTRDDLADGGAEFYAQTIRTIKKDNPKTKVEVLVPDFSGDFQSIQRVINAGCDIFSHNIETVRRLTPIIRDKKANYDLSLKVLETAHKIKPSLITKSGIMLGLGETKEEFIASVQDLVNCHISILTIGQYLKPTADAYPVIDYLKPKTFQDYQN
ncbi:MAG: lipoyl synthase, partial [candidate division WOR-3 bacterium]|nr:lipoyl synthase [candidate division WOR-3 bacterium]